MKAIPIISSTEIPSPQPKKPQVRKGVYPLTPLKEEVQRRAVIHEALKWNRTPYRSCADQLGAGIDCGMLLVRAWVDSGIFEPFDPRPYPREWHLHNSEERYLEWLMLFADEIVSPQPGDIALYRYGKCFSHGAIFVSPDEIIHAQAALGECCITHVFQTELLHMTEVKIDPLTGTYRPRPVKYFDIWSRLRQNEKDYV